MPRLKVTLLGFVLLLAPSPVLAHPGHVHYLLDPSGGGMLPVAVVLGAGVLVWLLGNRGPKLRPARADGPKSKDRERQTERR